MNQLFPGDQVRVPEPAVKAVPCRAEHRTHFVTKVARKPLHVVLLDVEGRPRGDVTYVLKAEGRSLEGKTGDDGSLAHEIDARTTEVTLTVGDDAPRTLRVGHLRPMREVPDGGVSGVQSRLRNLGFFAGEVDGRMAPSTLAAMRRFLAWRGKPVNDVLDDALFAELEQAHGC